MITGFQVLCIASAETHFSISEAGSTGPRRLDISYPTSEFTKLVKMWEKYEEASMGIIVKHIKRFVFI